MPGEPSSPPPARRASWAARAALAVVATLLTLLVAEGVLRLGGWPPEDPVWRPCRETAFAFAPHLDYRHMSAEYDVSFQTNSLGLRDDELGPKRGPRLLLLGDSFTCGYGVERAETFADRLEARLGEDVVNAGVGGFELVHHLHYFRSQGQKLQPDLVVLALYLNNDLTHNRLWRATAEGGLERADGRPALESEGLPKLVCLLKRPVALRRLFHALPHAAAPEARPGQAYLALCAEPLGPQAADDLKTALDLLRQLRDAVVASGAQFLVVSFPLRAVVEEADPEHYHPADEPAASYDLLRPPRLVAERLAAAGIAHLPLIERLRADRQRLGVPLYFRADGHFNATGHRCVAEHLGTFLDARKQGESSSGPRGEEPTRHD